MTALKQFEQLNEAWSYFPEHESSDYKIDTFIFRIYFGPSLKKLTKALSHLKVEEKLVQPDLTIFLWDASVKEEKLPPLDWPFLMGIPYCGYQEGPLYLHWFASIEALSLLHIEKKKAYYVVRKGHELPWWVEGAPLQVILHAWLQHLGLQLTHTAAIGDEKKALLLMGKGGSGKSTTTLSCLREGINYVGEDYSILQSGNEPKVLSIYQSAKWEQRTRKLFPQYESKIVNPIQAVQEKALLFYDELFPQQIRASLPVRATVSLSVGQGEFPILKPIDPFSAIQHLMMSTLKQLPFCNSQTVHFFKKISESLDHYHLTLGKNLQANIKILKNLLS